MHERTLVSLTSLFGVGVSAQWLAWRVRLPSILLLLAGGLLVGPGLGVVLPDQLLGPLLFPLTSLAVALILFEGGLSLRLGELGEVGGAVRNLTTVAVLLGWILGALAAWWVGGLSAPLSLLLGALLVVTGPTVIGPLLRHVRPQARVASVVKWEGIVNDPTGAILAVLVFEAILEGTLRSEPYLVAVGVAHTLLVGVVVGGLAAWGLVQGLRRRWIPDHLHSSVALMLVLVAFAVSNHAREEAGLVTVTLMGVVLANQHQANVRHIVEFYENLKVLLISLLFILLSARLRPEDLAGLQLRHLAFVVVLILVVRPVTVWLSTMGSELRVAERLFVAWMAPRGIVAAAVASLFAIRLEEAGMAGASQLVALTFLVILVTVAVYGLTAAPLARHLGLAERDPQGVLFLGADALARAIAFALVGRGYRVVLMDSRWGEVAAARLEGLEAWYGNALSARALHEVPVDGVGRMLAVTSNDEVNGLAALHFLELFERAQAYQLVSDAARERRPGQETDRHLRARQLFSPDATYARLAGILEAGGQVKATPLTDSFVLADALAEHGPEMVPLFVEAEDGRLRVVSVEEPLPADCRGTLISLAPGGGPEVGAG